MFKATVTTWFFFQKSFLSSDVPHSFSKLKKALTLVIILEKALEIDKFHFKTHLNKFISNNFQTCF
jgi:hypothetical protein